MSRVNRKFPYRFRQISLLLCFSLLLPLALGCGALNQLNPPAATSTSTASSTPTATITQTPTRTPTPTPTAPTVLCGGPPAMFILLVGSDARQDSYSIGLADSVRIVRLDFIDGTIQVLAFPRDLYVEIPEIADHNNITHGKLNQAFLYGNPGYNYYDGPGQGPGLLALTLEHNFGARVDHYVAVNLQTFVRIIDTLGGIDIELPYVIDGRVKASRDPNRYFAAGEQHLDGYRTMLLARLRPQGDFRRAEVQNLILEAIAKKALSPDVILKLLKLIEAFDDSVQTDLGPVEIGQLLCMRNRFTTHEIEFLSFPEDLFESARVRDPVLGNTSILDADFEVLSDYVQEFNDGLWGQPEEHLREIIDP
jgi:LCP family protein required for cell wall assembly